jgi:hypothetical protein
MDLVRKIASRFKKGTPEIFHTDSAIQKSGWRDFPQEKGRARFDALVRNVAAGTTRNAPILDALTALSATCGLTLSSQRDRGFLNQSLWDVWQSSGGCDAALQEVAVLARESRVDWLNDRDRQLVLEYFREIRQGTTAVAPWTSLSAACRRPGFDIRDPRQRWALLTGRHPLPSSAPIDSVEPALAERLAAIRRDQHLAGANTIRRFLALQQGTEREGLEAIVSSPDFIRWILSGESAPLQLRLSELPSRASGRRLNLLLRELSLRLHVENGAPALLLRGRCQEAHLILEKTYLDLPLESLEVTPEDQTAFQYAVTAPGETGIARSRFEGTVTDLAIMTHNRSRILETVRLYAENLIAFGHGGRGVRIHVFDDSTDDARPERRRSIEALAATYEGRGIPISYLGPEEKSLLREHYRVALENSVSTPEDRDRIRQAIEASIGEGGKGAQRNWMVLELGHGNVAMIDDDVYPWVELAPGWAARRVDVDVLSVLNRAASVPGALAVCFAYSGVPDWGEGDALQLHFHSLRFGVAWQRARLPSFRYAGPGDQGSRPRAWHTENWNPVTQGGILAMLGTQGLAGRVPSQATLATDLHCQDFVMGCLQDVLTRRQANESSWTLCPHGAVHHGRDQTARSSNKIHTALNEGLGSIFSYMIPMIAEEAGANVLIPGAEPRDVMTSLGRTIEDWLLRGNLNPDLMRRTVQDGIPLGYGVLSVIEYLRRLYWATGRRRWLYYPERKAYRVAIATAFTRFGWDRLLEPDASVELTDREWAPALDILHQETLGYARTLQIWPALTAVADARKATVLDAFQRSDDWRTPQ